MSKILTSVFFIRFGWNLLWGNIGQRKTLIVFEMATAIFWPTQGPTTWAFEGRADIDPDPARCRPRSYRPDMAPCRPRPTPTRHVLLRTTTIYNTFFFIHKLNPERTRCLFIIYDFCIASTIFVSIYSMFIQTNIHKELGSGTLTHNNDGNNGDSDQGLSLCRLFYSFHLLISLLFFPFSTILFPLHVGFACRVQ